MKNLFTHNSDSWSRISKKGIKNYIFKLGVLKLGIFIWFILNALKYFRKINFNFTLFNYKELLTSYFVWLPVAIIFSVFCSYYLWHENENKFNCNEH